ncbi:MAG: histidinol dehydrogenase [Trueperaceae bacterium]
MKLIRNSQEAIKLFSNRRLLDSDTALFESVQNVISNVRKRGDTAIKELSEKFDGMKLGEARVPTREFKAAQKQVDADLKAAIKLSATRIRAFYDHQPKEGFVWQNDGSLLGQIVRPLERVACYVPGGQVPLFSTLLMTAVPAQVAGVPEIAVTIPRNKKGKVAPEVLVAASELGIDEVYCLGGPVAIAALAYGTETIRKVDKIVGPGSRYTMAAKKLVFGDVGIEALPGPTETLVIADKSADVNHVVADLLAQAEHDFAQPVFVTTSESLAKSVLKVLEAQLKTLPTEETARASVQERGYIVLVKTLDEAVAVANAYAPEHLCLLVENPWGVVPGVKHAGGLFIGEHSMEALGDYLAGPSHVMPTSGTARFSSAINLRDFQKVIPFVAMSEKSVNAVGAAAAKMARSEGLEAHARAIESRLPKD